ncbi:sensor histidine kinase [Nocardiopsis sp. RSe5-2]|uniref:histidine kinase n=1 Tax=Nocardiopsis endophytica TaxID=3018445 RepID=A0ABT4UDG0_9ACTN|nr:sensor histidine kinase [Nocardiopsis endophytica]MDA2814996.1 sensor histidine kinase [Nocardiopsis endophytica]
MRGILRSLWDEPPPPGVPGRRWWDWALAGVCASAALAEGALRPDLPWREATTAVVAGLALVLPWRRTRPLAAVSAAFTGGALLSLASLGQAGEMFTSAFLLLLPFALVRWGSGRQIAVGAAVVALAGSVDPALDASDTGLADGFGGAAVLFAAGALGAALRFRSRARLRELEGARLRERERIARDLHDTVAHHVSAMAIRAQAGQAVAPARPEAAVEALAVIESEAARTLDEMRTLVRALRRDDPDRAAPAPGIAGVERLATRPGPGPGVDVEVSGAVGGLPPAVAAAVQRLAQEAVTNARRHARNATRIEVRVDADDTAVRLRVSDDGEHGPGGPLRRAAEPPGFGITGMKERAELLGGTCEAAPAPGRGWTVTAVLPRSGGAA